MAGFRVPRAATIHAALLLFVTACGGTAPSPTQPSTATASKAVTPIATAATPTPSIAAAKSEPPARPAWRAVAPIPEPRDGFETVLLGDGTVLIAGDDHDCHPGPAEAGSERAVVYDPAHDRWTAVQALNKPRIQFAMVPTSDGGAMVIGGLNAQDQPFSSTKVFHLDTKTWTDGPLLDRARGQPAAAAIGDGRIFVGSPTGHRDETTIVSKVVVYAPWTKGWSDDGSMDMGVEQLVLLTDGRLLATGSVFEISDWMFVATPGGAEGWHVFPRPEFEDVTTLVPLSHGGILAFGRGDPATGSTDGYRMGRYDRRTDRWTDTPLMPIPRDGAQVTTLGDGRVVVAGGVIRATGSDAEITRSTEIYDPVANAWARGPDLLAPRYGGTAVTLGDGSALVMGGTGVLNTARATPFCPGALTSVERLSPGA
jgi:galactose oxidase-like protein/Kelch motif protein